MLRFLRENLLLKIIALAASIMMSLYASTERNPNPIVSKRIRAVLSPVGSPPADLLLQVHPDPVMVEITGPRSEIEMLKAGDVKAHINLGLARMGTSQLAVQSYEVPPSTPNVIVREVGATFATVEVNPKQRKHFPITSKYKNEPPLGYLYRTPKIEPDGADISGSRSAVAQVDRLIVYIETQGGSVRGDFPIKAQDKDGIEVKDVEIEPPVAHVELGLMEAPTSRTLIVSVAHEGRAAYPYEIASIEVVPDQVTVVGKAEQLLALTNISTAPVYLEGIKSDVTRDVTLQLPAGVTVRGGKTNVRIAVKVRDTTRATTQTPPTP